MLLGFLIVFVLPRYAGVFRAETHRRTCFNRSSPLRGGHPHLRAAGLRGRKFFPATRGSSERDSASERHTEVLPRYAGVIRRGRQWRSRRASSSPLRGGHPSGSADSPGTPLFFPATRGSSAECKRLYFRMVVLPRYAGVIRQGLAVQPLPLSSSPLRGGHPPHRPDSPYLFKFFPATRGSSDGGLRPRFAARVLPPLRGGHPLPLAGQNYGMQFFPATRGSSAWNRGCHGDSAVLPRYAGVIRTLRRR